METETVTEPQQPLQQPQQQKSYLATVDLVPGDNTIEFEVPDALIENIALKATCDVQLKQAFHGQRSLMPDDQVPVDMSKLPEENCWYLQLEPAEEFQGGIKTGIVVHVAEAGQLAVVFKAPA